MVKIRLRRVGKKKQPSFRVVVADAKSPRDGRFIENIGHYNPRTNPPTVEIQEDRALYWLSQGAQPTSAVARMLRNMGTFEKLEQVHQGVSIEELVAPPEPEVEEVEPELEAAEAVAEAEAIVEEAAEEPEAPVAEEVAEAEEEVEEAALEEPEETEGPEEPEAAEEPEEPEVVEEPEAVAEPEAAVAEEVAGEAEESEAAPVAAVAPAEMSLEDLELSTRVQNVLGEAGLETAQDLLDKLAEGEAEFIAIPGAGGKTLEEVEERLAEHGLLEEEEEV